MSIIHRYLLKEVLIPSLLGTGVFIFVFMVSKLFRITDMVLAQGVPVVYALKLFLCLTPAFLVFVIPMAFLLGVLVALARLSVDHEILALKTSGVSLYRLSIPVAFLGVVTCLLTAFLVFYGVPWGSKTFRETLIGLAEKATTVTIQEHTFNRIFGGLVIYVDKISGQGKSFQGIMIHDERDAEATHTITAKKGHFIPEPTNQRVILCLFDGTIHSKDHKGAAYRTIDFDGYQFIISMREEMDKVRNRGGMRLMEKEMSIKDLREKITRLRAKGENVRPQLVELHFKFAIPLAALIFALVGVPLGIQRTDSGTSWGFILSLAIILLYYILFCLGKDLATYGVVSPLLGGWAPNIVFGVLGIYLFRKAAQESPVGLLVWGQQRLHRAKKHWKRFFREM